MADKKAQMAIVDDPSVREIYANKVIGTTFDGGALSITLGVGRFVPKTTDEIPKQGALPAVHVTSRLSLSPSAAVELANALKTMLDRLGKASAERQKDQKQHPAAEPAKAGR